MMMMMLLKEKLRSEVNHREKVKDKVCPIIYVSIDTKVSRNPVLKISRCTGAGLWWYAL